MKIVLKEKHMRRLDIVTLILVGIAGINWGLIALFKFNAVTYIVGRPWLVNITYIAMAVAALYLLIGFRAIIQRWKTNGGEKRR
jgi:uncharacterized membrane protein YuzA (DUF378 family)